jgi:hypothetical protein
VAANEPEQPGSRQGATPVNDPDRPTNTLCTAANNAYELATQMAPYLPGPAQWTAAPSPHDANDRHFALLVRDADAAEISLRLGAYRQEDRVIFRAGWPKYGDGRTYTPREYLSITCAVSRDPKALAREVERRLLVTYDPAYRAAREDVRASDGAAADAWSAALRIARAVGAELPVDRDRRNGAAVHLRGGPERIYGLKIHPGYGDDGAVTVSFDVHSVDENTALAMLAALLPRSTH